MNGFIHFDQMCLNKGLCGILSTVKTQSLKQLTSCKETQSKSLKFVNGLKPPYHTLTFLVKQSLRKMCPNTELFLVRIFLYSDWIRTRNNSVFGHYSRSEYLLLLEILQMLVKFFIVIQMCILNRVKYLWRRFLSKIDNVF